MRHGWRKFYDESEDLKKTKMTFSLKELRAKAERNPSSLTEEECLKLDEFQAMCEAKG